MQFDDRLATVLRMQTGGVRAAHTQFRQLLDLAGSAPESTDDARLGRAYDRLSALSAEIPLEIRAAMIRDPGLRLRNPAFIAYLASQELPIAKAAMSNARLSEAQWEALIPALPVPVRAHLRQRTDLPPTIRDLLALLGVRDLVLPQPDEASVAIDQPGRATQPAPAPAAPAQAATKPHPTPEPKPKPVSTPASKPHPQPEPQPASVLDLDPALALAGEEGPAGIGAIVRRIEAFQRTRAATQPHVDAPRLPLGEHANDGADDLPQSFDFTTDADGRISWAGQNVAPMTVGMMLAGRKEDSPARPDAATLVAMRRRQPVRGGHLVLEGAPAIAGKWRMDAMPVFSPSGGRFSGYRGRMRRLVEEDASLAPAAPVDSPADRMRQIIHELRTPVNAIQGFAEIIQQQLFGPTPNEYRALAASIAGDAARMLAGFEELDRLVKLESGALELDEGSCDLRSILAGTVGQLDRVLRARSAGLSLQGGDGAAPVPLTRGDGEMLIWRMVATLAGAVSPGEELQVMLGHDGSRVILAMDLPAALAGRDDLFESTAPALSQAVSAGMFGAGFTLRLARAEARATRGDLCREGDRLLLTLPLAAIASKESGNYEVDLRGQIAETG
ncbi:sensor histidine kinase [Altererythrobacter sp. CC-YST694]|uniref:histidine kinase dimerization/phospho-acceptor domain-containing protein n=1 Tax=Altererythrobacter sp. CC-YST694 TaxID=2755038 RepID=UPI0021F7F26B|nr:histidine kinase dimerization/phospho-acceptor domain-containing protein [Altererythrobacter sp. CC-YST694]MCB5424796.1 sensor histidine kinase [Altererythrobacter sp. CC-YST694]